MFSNEDSLLHARYGSIGGICFDKKLILLPLCCKTSMQTCCGLTDCTGNSPETAFSLWRLRKSCVSYKSAICISFKGTRNGRVLGLNPLEHDIYKTLLPAQRRLIAFAYFLLVNLSS